MGRRRGKERKRRKAGSSFAGQTLESLPRETKGGMRDMSTLLMLREFIIPIQK